jgi:hypothetical protein
MIVWTKDNYSARQELNVKGWTIIRCENRTDEKFTLQIPIKDGVNQPNVTLNAATGTNLYLTRSKIDEKKKAKFNFDPKEQKKNKDLYVLNPPTKDLDGSTIYVIRKHDNIDVTSTSLTTPEGKPPSTNVAVNIVVEITAVSRNDKKGDDKKKTPEVKKEVKTYVEGAIKECLVMLMSGTKEVEKVSGSNLIFKGSVKANADYSVKVVLPSNKKGFECKITLGDSVQKANTKTKEGKPLTVNVTTFKEVTADINQTIKIECSNAIMVQMTVLFGVMLAYLL